MNRKIEIENPAVIASFEQLERREAQRLLVQCAIISLSSNKDVAKAITDRERAQIKNGIANATTQQLYERLYALQKMNPGCLISAMKNMGYSIRTDSNGNATIDPNVNANYAGQVIDYNTFVENKN